MSSHVFANEIHPNNIDKIRFYSVFEDCYIDVHCSLCEIDNGKVYIVIKKFDDVPIEFFDLLMEIKYENHACIILPLRYDITKPTTHTVEIIFDLYIKSKNI